MGNLAFCLIFGATAAYQAGIAGLTDRALQQQNPQRALRLSPSSSNAAESLAGAALLAGKSADADALARRAVARSPANVSAYGLIALAHERAGQPEAATRMFLAASELGWRDVPTQLWVMNRAFEVGDYTVAVQRADALLRQDVFRAELFGVLRAAAAEPAAARALAKRLAVKPHWRARYMNTLAGLTPEELSGHENLLASLKSTEVPASRVERANYANKLAELGAYGRARAIWTDQPGMEPASVSDFSFDGYSRFVVGEARSTFEWTVDAIPGAWARVETPPFPHGGAALRAQTSGSSIGVLARQTLVLAPGRYRFSSLARFDGPHAQMQLTWTLRCLEGPRIVAPPPQADDSREQSGWARIGFLFDVPAECPAQMLELRATSFGPREASAWFDDVAIREAD